MLDKKHIVNVPDGAIVRSNRIVLWTIEKRYSPKKQYNNDARRQIGKALEADRTKMYPNDNYKELFPDGYNECVDPKISPSWQSIGLYTALKYIAERLPLYDCLYKAFGKEDTDLILDYAMYSIAYESSVSQHFEKEMSDKALFSEKLRSDSYLSGFFKNHLAQEKIDLFLDLWAPAVIKHKGIRKMYANVDGSNDDCSSASSDMAEKGHSKSGKNKNIINVMYTVAPDGTPISFIQYRGSVVDSVAMQWVIKYAESLKLKLQGFCIDRGFCGKEIADYIKQANYNYVMMLTDNVDSYTDAVVETGSDIRNNADKWLFDNELFADTVEKPLFKKDTDNSYIHIFYDCEKGGATTAALLRNIRRAINEASAKLAKGELPVIPSNLKKYFGFRQGTGPKTLEYYTKDIQDAIDAKGFFGLATSKKMSALEAHEIYSSRDASEKQYMVMKSEIGLDTYRVGKDPSIRGKQFVAFVAGILRNELLLASKEMLKEKANPSRYSTTAVIKELTRIQIKRMPGDVYALVMNLSARDEFMLKHLGLRAKDLDKVVKDQNLRIKGKV